MNAFHDKVIRFLDMANILLMFLAWHIFPKRHSRAEPAGIWVSSNHPGGSPPVSLSLIPPVSPGISSILSFPALEALRSNSPELTLAMGFKRVDQTSE